MFVSACFKKSQEEHRMKLKMLQELLRLQIWTFLGKQGIFISLVGNCFKCVIF